MGSLCQCLIRPCWPRLASESSPILLTFTNGVNDLLVEIEGFAQFLLTTVRRTTISKRIITHQIAGQRITRLEPPLALLFHGQGQKLAKIVARSAIAFSKCHCAEQVQAAGGREIGGHFSAAANEPLARISLSKRSCAVGAAGLSAEVSRHCGSRGSASTVRLLSKAKLPPADTAD